MTEILFVYLLPLLFHPHKKTYRNSLNPHTIKTRAMDARDVMRIISPAITRVEKYSSYARQCFSNASAFNASLLHGLRETIARVTDQSNTQGHTEA